MERPSHKTPRVDCLEGQRPRLTHFSTMAARNRFQTALPPNPRRSAHCAYPKTNDFAVHDFANPATPLRG